MAERDKGMPDGYQIQLDLAIAPSAPFWIKKLTPPSLEGGDPIDTTVMDNAFWKSKYPQALIEVGPMTMTCAYSPEFYDQATAIINQPGSMILTFPSGSTLTLYGWVRSFKPNEAEIGQQPTAMITIEFGNETFDDATFTETGPEWAAAP